MLTYDKCGELLSRGRKGQKLLEENTYLSKEGDYFSVRFHGSEILRIFPDKVQVSSAGYPTPTTADRLMKWSPLAEVSTKGGFLSFRCGFSRVGPTLLRLHWGLSSDWVTIHNGGKIEGGLAPYRDFDKDIYDTGVSALAVFTAGYVISRGRAPRGEALSQAELLEALVAGEPSEDLAAQALTLGLSRKKAAEELVAVDNALDEVFGYPEGPVRSRLTEELSAKVREAVGKLYKKHAKELVPLYAEEARRNAVAIAW